MKSTFPTPSTNIGRLSLLVMALCCCHLWGLSQNLANNTNLSITKTWPQAPNGYTYPVAIAVPPGPVPPGGFPVCILLHGNGGSGGPTIGQFISGQVLLCHILIAPTGYQNSWNICREDSDAPDVEMVGDLVNALQGYTNVNHTQIRVLGLSNGAGLANRVFIENKNLGLDRVCAIVSHLNEPQYHNGDFHQPAGVTDSLSTFCGYDSVASPLPTRKYLSISNDNDNLIPYNGGSSLVGVSFLPAETAAFTIATFKGYSGSILTSGVTTGNPAITEFSYLAGDVVHIKGTNPINGHAPSTTALAYVTDFFEDCAPPVGTAEPVHAQIALHPQPTGGPIQVQVGPEWVGAAYSVHDHTGKSLISGNVHAETIRIDLGHLPAGLYLVQVGHEVLKVLKQ